MSRAGELEQLDVLGGKDTKPRQHAPPRKGHAGRQESGARVASLLPS